MSRPKSKKDKNTEVPEADADNPEGGTSESDTPAPIMVTVVRTAQAPKLNPARSGGAITYECGRIDGKGISGVVIRLKDNEGGGQFSKEWVPIERLRACFTPAALAGEAFRVGVAFANAHVGRSSTNPGFLAAVLRAEGLITLDPQKKGLGQLSGNIEAWAEKIRQADAETLDDGTVKLEPLVPPKRDNPFAAMKDRSTKKTSEKRSRTSASDADAGTTDVDPDEADTADAVMCTAEA